MSFRHISIERDEYAVPRDGMKMFGLLETQCRLRGHLLRHCLRNVTNDKSKHVRLIAGYRVFIYDNMGPSGDFKPMLTKHSKNFDLTEALSIGVDRIQRG